MSAERNARIVDAYRRGATTEALADRFGLSRQRISGILAERKDAKRPRGRPLKPAVEVPAWVPAHLVDAYALAAFHDCEQAAASLVRKLKHSVAA